MNPKLSRPYVLQPVANGIALFPLEMAQKGTLDFAKIHVFTEMERTYEYPSEGKLLNAIAKLIENGDSPNPDQIPLDTAP